MSKTSFKNWSIETKAIHTGENIDPITRASSPNLVMSSTFCPDRVAGFSAHNRSDYEGYSYARVSNPTVDQLSEKLTALENAQHALCFASGMAASHALLAGRLNSGDHLIISDTNYVGTAELVRDSLPRWGIEVTPVDTSDLNALEDAIQTNTKMIWIETPANPIMRLTDITASCELARLKSVRDVVVDSTFATPMATKPIELGADFVVHSLTKYIGGHGDAMGGAVLGRKEDLESLNLEAMVHYGGVLSPFNAWLILRGAATFPVRMRAHETTAMKVAYYLQEHPKIKSVHYPGLSSHPQYDLAQSQMKNFSAMMSFQTYESGEQVAARMIEKFKFIHYAVSLGHHRSLIYWIPTQMLMKSSYRLSKESEKRYREFADDGVFRFSVGIEDADDICNELDNVI